MFEKRFPQVAVQLFVADGMADGTITLADTSLFKVKQKVIVAATGLATLDQLEIKSIFTSTTLIVGPITNQLNSSVDLSAYTTSLHASIYANEQRRPSIAQDEFNRAKYEEEPTVAERVILVDKLGNRYDDSHPFPTSATFSGSISVGEVDQGNPNTSSKAWPTKLTDGTNTVIVNSDGSVNANIISSVDAPGLLIAHNEVTLIPSGAETTLITVTAPIEGQRVETIVVSGDTVGLFRVKLNGTTIITKRSSYTEFNQIFDFQSFTNGLLLTSGQVLTVTVIQSGESLASFEATVLSI